MSCLDLYTAPTIPTAPRLMSSRSTQRPHPRLQRSHPQSLSSLTMPPISFAPQPATELQHSHPHPQSHSHPHLNAYLASSYSHPQHNGHTGHSQHSMPHPHTPTLLPAASSSSLHSANPFSPSTHPTRSVTEIIPRLFISDLSFAENPACLTSHRITHVLSTLPDSIYIPPATLLFPHPPPARLQVRIEDFPFAELAAHLPNTTAWITDALARDPNSRVLVHCAEGISRSVSVVAAYLMSQFGWTPSEAVKFIKSKRVVAEPNFGFVQQLHEYARDSLGRSC